MDKAKKFGATTENLNKSLNKLLDTFAQSTQWSDINHWLLSLESILRQNPSPYITEKILLAKRLNQCVNPILPEETHKCVLRIHQLLFYNMRISVDNNINQYIKLFAEDLGTYSLTILPYFTHTSVTQHRLMCLGLLNDYYLDLGLQLIPMLSGILKSMLPVYGETLDEALKNQIDVFMDSLIFKVGRKYVISYLWSAILKFQDCRLAGIKFLGKFIDKMDFIKDEEEYSSSHGFSEEEEEIRKEQIQAMENQAKKSANGQPAETKQQGEQSLNYLRADTFDPQGKIPLTHIVEEDNEDEIIEEKRNLESKEGSQIEMSLFSHFPSKWQSSHEVKLNKVPLVLRDGMQLIKEGINSNAQENNYPRHSSLIVSTLVSCLEDQSNVVRRMTLDFMFTHLRMKSDVLDEDDKRLLVEAMIRLFKKKEISTTKRVNRWLFGKENEENEYLINQKNQFVLSFIVLAFKKILGAEPTDEETCTLPLKILQNFYMEHSNLLEKTLPFITVNILRYVYNYGTGLEYSEEIFKAGKRFFENIPSHYELFLCGIGTKFIESVSEANEPLSFECVQYIDFCYLNMMKHDHGQQELEYITLTIEKLAGGIEEFTLRNKQTKSFYRTFLKDAILLIFNLLARKESVSRRVERDREKTDRKFYQEIGVHDHSPVEEDPEQLAREKRYFSILENIESFFIELGQIIKSKSDLQVFEEVYKLTAMAMIKIQNHLPHKFVPEALPKWFHTIELGIKVANPIISLSAIESMIQCLLSESKHPIYAKFKSLIMEAKVKKVGNDYQHLALEKLWSLLDYPQMHSKIIDLIIAFSKFFPYEFTETVKKSFGIHNDPDKEASIQRFSHFWRLTGFKYKDLVLSNRQFAEINKVGLFMMLDFLDDQNPLVRHAVKNWLIESMPLLSRILEPLFYELMKISCDWYKTPKGLYIIKNKYDTKTIFNAFRRLRSILSNGTYAFLRYIYQTPITESLLELREKITPLSESFLTTDKSEAPQLTVSMLQKEPGLGDGAEEDRQNSALTFMDMLVVIAVKYIEGNALESMGIDFYLGNAGVNTSAIELLETLINYIDNPSLCYKIINYLNEPLHKVLSQSVVNKEYITQIQLLNLFRTLFFSSSFRKKGELKEVRTFLKLTFNSEFFVGSLLQGLQTSFAYVRSQFINFITVCIPLIADFLEPEDCTRCVKKILLTYYTLIKEIKINVIEEVLEEGERAEEEPEGKRKMMRINEIEKRAKKEEKLVKISGSLNEATKTNEIQSVLHGVSVIMNYFFDFDKLNIKDMKFQFSNPYTIFDTVKSIVTLGFASTEKTGKLIEKTQFLHNLDTCEAIIGDLSPVFEIALGAWPLSEEYVRIATEDFSSIGMKTFNFEKFSRYNNVLKKLIAYVEEEKESIWGRIFSIIQPMFYKLPREITNIYLTLWARECTDPCHPDEKGRGKPLGIRPNAKNTEFLMKIIQTIVVNNFPMNILVHAFLESSLVEEVTGYYSQKTKNKNFESLDYRIAQLESKLLYFLYVYFTHSHIGEDSLQKENLLEIWSLIMKAVKPFLSSKVPSTALWILDFVNMCARKYSPKELLTIEKFKTDLHALVNDKLKYTAAVASKAQPLFYEDPLAGGFNSDKNDQNRYRVILPIPPSLYEVYKKKASEKNATDRLLYIPVNIGNCNELQKLYRVASFKALKIMGLEILQNTYLSEKMHFAVKRGCEWMEILFPSIEDKSKQMMTFAECASEVLHDLLDKARVLFIKPLRSSILRVFNKDDFFICNETTLKYWSEIVDWVVSIDKHNETFDEYLGQVSLSSSYFTSESTENKNRIKSFERICFILYSGAKDKYALKIKSLLEKIVGCIMTAESSHPALLILILFSLRILILKLSEISLSQLFADLWPMLLAFFMEIFSKRLIKIQITNSISRNPNLLLAALKLIELISIANLAEFAHHEWIFVHDYFGTRFQLSEPFHELNQFLAKRPEVGNVISFTKTSKESPFLYKPYLLNSLPAHSIDYGCKQGVGMQMGYKPMKRIIIVKESFIRSEEELHVYALLLSQYLALKGEYRMEADLEEVEKVIINDFISLDSFIHKI